MKVLLVEDDEDKREQLKILLHAYFQLQLSEAKSFQAALREIKSDVFDLVLLDMTIPTFDISSTESGGRSQAFGGELLLYEISRRKLSSKVIVVTQFDLFGKGDEEVRLPDLNKRLEEKFAGNYLGAIQYSMRYDAWKETLLQKMKEQILNR